MPINNQEPLETTPSYDFSAFQARRFRTITIGLMLVMLLVITQFIIEQKWTLVIISSLNFSILGIALLLERYGHINAAYNCMIGTMTMSVVGFMTLSEGIHDLSFITFPSILIVGSMLLQRRAYIVTLSIMILCSAILVVAEMKGFKTITIDNANYGTMFDAAIILIITAFAAWILASDMRTAINQAIEETNRANAAQAQLRYLADHDPLTNLPNRALAGARVDQAIATAKRKGTQAGVLFIDLDNFKTVNDSLGHTVGDKLLQGIAQRLITATRETDTVCRLGGDEFLIVTPDLADNTSIHVIIDKLTTLIRKPFIIDDQEVTTSMSIGVAIAPNDGEDFDTLHQNADIAMYRAKESGRSTYRFFDQSMHDEAVGRLGIRNGLTRALESSEFTLHYQPKINLQTNQLTGVEALLRWHNDTLGLVSPVDFIPVAEASGLIVAIGEWVIRESCRQLKAWQQSGLVNFSVAVNVSSVQFCRADISQLVATVLNETALEPHYLELELTESVVLEDSEAALNSAQQLRELGVKLSLDDFGTGYSSMSYLRRLAIDTLKIDRSFIHDVTTNTENAAITTAIIQLARGLDIKTIAEGVEDAETLNYLTDNGCDEIQGYYIAKPMLADDFIHWLDQRKR